MAQRREILKWQDVDQLIDRLLGQFKETYDAMLMISTGGIVPGGLLADAMKQQNVMIASVDFPAEMEAMKQSRLLAWPKFLQFPPEEKLADHKILVVDDVWGSGRTITSVKNHVAASRGIPFTCVLHFNPYRNLFGSARPDYFAESTDAYIIYPWEIDRGMHGELM
jgi:hypoxanthine phosphoribosyltransferase